MKFASMAEQRRHRMNVAQRKVGDWIGLTAWQMDALVNLAGFQWEIGNDQGTIVSRDPALLARFPASLATDAQIHGTTVVLAMEQARHMPAMDGSQSEMTDLFDNANARSHKQPDDMRRAILDVLGVEEITTN